MLVVHHYDCDGLCAAHIIADFYEHTPGIKKIRFWVGDHKNDPKSIEELNITKNEIVFIVDYSFPVELMEQLMEITSNVMWIDHHITTWNSYNDSGFVNKIKYGIFKSGISACMLTWYYFTYCMATGNNVKFRECVGDELKFLEEEMLKAPLYLQYANDWDVWNLKYSPQTNYFITAFNSLIPEFSRCLTSDLWDMLCTADNSGVTQFIENGKVMEQFKDGWAQSLCNNYGFDVNIKGLKCFCLNCGLLNSTYFNCVDKTKYDAFATFCFNGKKWSVSLYSTGDADVGAVCKQLGGGGHRGAAGFTTDRYPFDVFTGIMTVL